MITISISVFEIRKVRFLTTFIQIKKKLARKIQKQLDEIEETTLSDSHTKEFPYIQLTPYPTEYELEEEE